MLQQVVVIHGFAFFSLVLFLWSWSRWILFCCFSLFCFPPKANPLVIYLICNKRRRILNEKSLFRNLEDFISSTFKLYCQIYCSVKTTNFQWLGDGYWLRKDHKYAVLSSFWWCPEQYTLEMLFVILQFIAYKPNPIWWFTLIMFLLVNVNPFYRDS